MTARSILGAELAQLEAETFEIQDIPELDQNMAGSTSVSARSRIAAGSRG